MFNETLGAQTKLRKRITMKFKLRYILLLLAVALILLFTMFIEVSII